MAQYRRLNTHREISCDGWISVPFPRQQGTKGRHIRKGVETYGVGEEKGEEHGEMELDNKVKRRDETDRWRPMEADGERKNKREQG